jgi:hypothetical protein
MSDFIFRQAFIYFVSFPRMELVTGGLSTNASEAVSAILAMSYVELRAIVVAAIVRNTNDKTKMT